MAHQSVLSSIEIDNQLDNILFGYLKDNFVTIIEDFRLNMDIVQSYDIDDTTINNPKIIEVLRNINPELRSGTFHILYLKCLYDLFTKYKTDPKYETHEFFFKTVVGVLKPYEINTIKKSILINLVKYSSQYCETILNMKNPEYISPLSSIFCRADYYKCNKCGLLELLQVLKLESNKVSKYVTTLDKYYQNLDIIYKYCGVFDVLENRFEHHLDFEKMVGLVENEDYLNLEFLHNRAFTDYLVEFFNVENIDLHTYEYMTGGVNSGVGKVIYNLSSEHQLEVVIKNNGRSRSDGSQSDNTYYEYLVGLCLNRIRNRFPFFYITIGAFKFTPEDYNRLAYESTNPIDHLIPIDNLSNEILESCRTNHYGIATQKIVGKNFNYFLKNLNPDNFFDVYACYYLIYFMLDSIKNVYTHYDLHGNNVMIYELPDNKHITINARYNDGRNVELKTRLLPVLIDYGKNYIDCNNYEQTIINKSTKILTRICNNDNRVGGPCNDVCGNKKGYRQTSDRDKHNESNPNEFIFKDPRKACNVGSNNISTDLRLLWNPSDYGSPNTYHDKINRILRDLKSQNIIQENIETLFNYIKKPVFKTTNNIYATEIPENSCSLDRQTYPNNVSDAHTLLYLVYSDARVNRYVNTRFPDELSYGTLNLYEDREFEFLLN
jgi:hypothetical protein